MAVTNSVAAQLAADYRKNPREDSGKFRLEYFKVTTIAGDANSTLSLAKLPAGAVRVIPGLSRISSTALGAARTLAIGHKAYTKNGSGTQEAESATALMAATDFSGAIAGIAFSTAIKYDMYSTGGIDVFATVAGAALDADEVVEGYIVYVTE